MVPGITPYKIDIQQGNYVTQDMVAKLKPGMSKSQVRFALGTPLIVDPFHTERWDYVYELKKRGRVIEHRRIVVLFADDKLIRIDGDVAPTAASAIAGASASEAAAATPPAAQATGTATTTPALPVTGTALEPSKASESSAAPPKQAP
jgi:outer membrane protein assembly factor BamE